MEAGVLPKVEVDGLFTRQFRKGEEGIPSQDSIILGIWTLVKILLQFAYRFIEFERL